jgi:hypothetical protein
MLEAISSTPAQLLLPTPRSSICQPVAYYDSQQRIRNGGHGVSCSYTTLVSHALARTHTQYEEVL